MRRGLAVLGVAAVALVLPGAALAHVTLTSSEPVTQSRVETPPTKVTLRFNGPVTITPNAVRVLAPDGKVLSGAPRVTGDGRVVVTPEALVFDVDDSRRIVHLAVYIQRQP